jgi:hypothetical protein
MSTPMLKIEEPTPSKKKKNVVMMPDINIRKASTRKFKSNYSFFYQEL